MVADEEVNAKTRERTEGTATAVQAMQEVSCSADRVDSDPMCSNRFGNDCSRPPAPPCGRDNVLVDNDAAASNSCLPSLGMRTTTAAGGLLPTGDTSTATKITSNRPTLRPYLTEETNSRTVGCKPAS